MGTHYHDQPPEHWAGEVSLDPTPVWKQFLLVGVLLLVAIALIVTVALFALAPQLAIPPTVVPGGRVVLSLTDLPASGSEPKRFGPPLVDAERAFWLGRSDDGQAVAVSATWIEPESGTRCAIEPQRSPALGAFGYLASCPGGVRTLLPIRFGLRGEPLTASRSLDRYLVSVDRDRVIVNIGREIRGYGATPQPRVSPLATP